MLKNTVLSLTLCCFFINSAVGASFAYVFNGADELRLPSPGIMLQPSPKFNPAILKGLKVNPDNPFKFDFILDPGDTKGTDFNSAVRPIGGQELVSVPNIKQESIKLIKYFLASLTIPEKDLWVNLSPYEKNRIVPEAFGKTEMGRDLLAEDYILKQITASLMYPEGEAGKRFWTKIYQEAIKRFGTTNIPVNTFNKVWIVPDKAVVYENAKVGTAYVVESRLKVMLEEDYLASKKNNVILSEVKDLKVLKDFSVSPQNDINALSSQVIRDIIIPELTKEVNEGQNFAQLRQVYNSFILASWYKKKIRESILTAVYENKNKVSGVLPLPNDGVGNPQQIYQRYLQAFKKGVYNFIKEEPDSDAQNSIARKYFAGGTRLVDNAQIIENDSFVDQESSDHLMEVSGQWDPVLPNIFDGSMKAALRGMHDKAMMVPQNKRSGESVEYQRGSHPVTWGEADSSYDPPEYTSEHVLREYESNPENGWADPVDPKDVQREFTSFEKILPHDSKGRPRNPRGPTGLSGRSDLGRWGANFSVDGVIRRINPKNGKEQFLALWRRDAHQWALPGAFRRPGEGPLQALERVIKEKTGMVFNLSHLREAYKGYVNDPRNTDNAWVETQAFQVIVSDKEAQQLIPKSDHQVVLWLDVDTALEKNELYASHSEILKAAISQEPLESLIASTSAPMAAKAEVLPSDFYFMNEGAEAPTYADYKAKFKKSKTLDKFFNEFFAHFIEAVKAYEQSGKWRGIHRKYFQKAGEDLYEALENNGFYESQEFFCDRIVNRYMRAKKTHGGKVEELVPVNIVLSELKDKADEETWQQDRDLMKEIFKDTYKQFHKGKIKYKGIPINFWKKAVFFVMKEAASILTKEFFKTIFAVGAAWISLHLIGGFLPSWLKDSIGVGIGIGSFFGYEWVGLPIAHWVKQKAEEGEEYYYERLLQNYILGRTPEQSEKIKKEFHDYFSRVREALAKVDQGADKTGQLNRKMLDMMEGYVLKGVEDYQQSIWIAELGIDQIHPQIKGDTRSICMIMLKELADQNPKYYERLVANWKRKKSVIIKVRKALSIVGYKLRSYPSEEFLSMVKWIEKLQHKNFTEELAQKRGLEDLNNQGKEHDHTLGVRVRHQMEMLKDEHKVIVHGIFNEDLRQFIKGLRLQRQGELLDDAEDSFVLEDPADRGRLVRVYWGGALTRVRVVRERLKGPDEKNVDYRFGVERLAKYIWSRDLTKILKEQREHEELGTGTDYGIGLQEVESLLDQLNEHRIYSTMEAFRREVLNQIPDWVYKDLALEVGRIVARKDVADDGTEPAHAVIDRRNYDVFRKIMEADSNYWEGLTGIIHQGFLKASNDQANAEAKNKKEYEGSLMVDVRLFDTDYSKRQASQQDQGIAAGLMSALDQRNLEVRHFLAQVNGDTESHQAAAHVKLKFYHLKVVDDYIHGRQGITEEQMRERVISFYRLAKRLPQGVQLDPLLTERLNAQFAIVAELKDVHGNSLIDDAPIRAKMAEIADPLIASWGYLMGQVPKFGSKAGERRAWLLSLRRSAIGVIGILQNKGFFDDIEVSSGTQMKTFFETINANNDHDKVAALKLRKLLQYFYGVLELEEDPKFFNGEDEHNFNWLAKPEQGSLLVSNWFIIREMIYELGLDAEDRFKDVLELGDQAAKKQTSGEGGDNLSNMIRTYQGTDAAMNVEVRRIMGRGNDEFTSIQPIARNRLRVANGGIDLSSDKAVAIKNSGILIKFHINPAQLAQMQKAQGFVPVVTDMRLLKNLKLFLEGSVLDSRENNFTEH